MDIIKKLTDTIPVLLIYALAFLLPVIFTPLTTEYFDTAKLVLLGLCVILLSLLWVTKSLIEGKISIVKTPLDILFLTLLVVAVLSTVLSPTPYPSLFGLLPKVSGSLIFYIIIILFYFMIVSSVKTPKQIQNIIYLMIFSASLVALVSLLAYFKIFLPFKAAEFTNFSLAGSTLSTTIYLILMLPLTLTIGLKDKFSRIRPTAILAFASFFIFAVTIVLIGNLGIWIGALLSITLTLYFLKPSNKQTAITGLIGLIVLMLAILSYTPTLKDKTALGNYASNFQKEIQLPFTISWKISAGAFRDSPILGTGPGTYLYNFTQYKPVEINKTDLWDKRVSSANNQYFQTLAELGGAGVILLSLAALTFIFMAARNRDQDGLALSGISFLVLMALTPMSTLTTGVGFLILALFFATLREKHSQVRQMETRLGGEHGIHPLLPTLIFIPVLALSLAGFYFLGKLSLGEFYHRKAMNAIASNEQSSSSNKALDGYNFLVQAEKINPQVDLYRVDLAQTNFALANAIAAAKAPSEASPGGSLTEDDKKNIQQLLQQAIAEGKAASALALRSATNWEVLANIYRQISGVAQNATQFSLNAYSRALQQDPLNPLLRLTIGGMYYQAKNYDLAVRFFDDAVSLKPDFPNALYNLSIALREKGSLQDAARVAERLVAILQDRPDSNDYQIASQLLSELKKKIEDSSATESAKLQTEPGSALEKNNLPNVIDLPKPEKISTPPAVQR